jgi:hypothetical protein
MSLSGRDVCTLLTMQNVTYETGISRVPTGNNPVSSGMTILKQRHTTRCLYKGTQEQNNATYLYSIIKEQVTKQYITVLLYYN